MGGSALRLTLGIGLALLPGCRQPPRRCPCCSGAVVSGVVTPPQTAPAKSSPPGAVALGKDESQPAPEPVPTVPDRLVSDGRQLGASHDQVSPAQPTEPDPRPGHAPDHRWLVGHLQYVHVRNAWRLRYAAPDERDRYGGSVTLADPGPMTGFRSGQLVWVEGRLLDPESRDPSPAYQVHAIRPLSPP